MPTPASASERVEEFVRLLSRHEARIHAYILTLLPNWADAADVLQETNSVMWRKFGDFKTDTNFFAWACQIARLEVLAFRKRNRNVARTFTNEFLEAVANKAESLADTLEARQHHLGKCIERLREKDRQLLRDRYFKAGSVETLAQQWGRSVEAIYKALQRVRRQLVECVEQAVAQEARS